MQCADVLTLLGERVRSIRKMQGITQERLAELADLNLSYLSEIERGQANVSLCIVNSIANALGITLSELLGGIPGEIINADFLALIQQVQGLDESQQKIFLKTAQGVLSGIRET